MRTGLLFWLIGALPLGLMAQFSVGGQVSDAEAGEPLPFVQVRALRAGTGTLSNAEGAFTLQLPGPDTLLVSGIGYDPAYVPVSRAELALAIPLATRTYSLAEVLIVPVPATDLLRQALAAIPENHGHDPVMMQAFYRELVSENGQYVELNEAVVDLYKCGNAAERQRQDQVRLIRGRRRGEASRVPNVNISLGTGGIHAMSGMAVTAEPFLPSFLDPDNFKLYTYELVGVEEYLGRKVYEITFDQARRLRKKLYMGTIYLDVETLAFASIAFEISPQGKKVRASQFGGLKMQAAIAMARLFGYEFEFVDEQGRLDFRPQAGAWYLAYNGRDLEMAMHIPEKATYTEAGDTLPQDIVLRARRELAVTGFQPGPATSFAPEEQFSRDSTLASVAGPYEDAFWAGYSYLAPTQSLRRAAEAIRREE